jgi:hypothetical protein
MLGFFAVVGCFGFARAGLVTLCARLIATDAFFAGDEAMTDQSVGPVYTGLLLRERSEVFIVVYQIECVHGLLRITGASGKSSPVSAVWHR